MTDAKSHVFKNSQQSNPRTYAPRVTQIEANAV